MARSPKVLTYRALLHHCHIVNIWGNSYRMKEHRELRESMRRQEGGDSYTQMRQCRDLPSQRLRRKGKH